MIKKRGSLVDEAYLIIKKAIINMDVKPGQPLTEERLVEQLGISRTPLRSALNRLSCEELVDIYPGRGTFVSQVSYEEMVDTLNVRLVLEKLAAQQSVEKSIEGYDKYICQLEAMLSLQEEWVIQPCKKDDMFGFLQYDNCFHRIISEMASNKVLKKQIMGLKDKFNRFVILANTLNDRIPAVIEEHRQVLEAIRAKDPALAEEAMAAHILKVQQSIEAGMKIYLA